MDGSGKFKIAELARALEQSDSVIIGAGAGLSSAAGYHYAGERFEHCFSDFRKRYGFRDMYSGGFYPYQTLEEFWAYWSRHIWINRYAPMPTNTYSVLLSIVRNKDHFVITSNVDHCFQRSGFDKARLFYTQGDYGLFQCSLPCCDETWDNYEQVRAMVEAQGFKIADDGTLGIPEGIKPTMTVPRELVPTCPNCGRPLTTNLRVDNTFVEDAGWHKASKRYGAFLRTHIGRGQHTLLLELGVGSNTPAIIKYPFWRMTANSPDATYACMNLGEAYAPAEIRDRSILVDEDIGAGLRELKRIMEA